jgi:hypothetical protein
LTKRVRKYREVREEKIEEKGCGKRGKIQYKKIYR